MCEEFVLVHNVRHRQKVKLLLSTTAGRIDRKEDGPCDEAPYDAHHDGELEESQEEEPVQGMVVEDPCIWNSVELGYPAEEGIGHNWRALEGFEATHERPWSIAVASRN